LTLNALFCGLLRTKTLFPSVELISEPPARRNPAAALDVSRERRSKRAARPDNFAGRINHCSTEFGTISPSLRANVPSAGEITGLLDALRRNDPEAEAEFIKLIYDELHVRAMQSMRREHGDHALQPTAMAHETSRRLMQEHQIERRNGAHFFATACIVWRRIVARHTRVRAAERRPVGSTQVGLDEFPASESPRFAQLRILDETLTRLSGMDKRQGRLVEMMHFGGLTEEEAAPALVVSFRAVKRDWSSARGWLQARLSTAAG
jgi:RNA polymerase sigma-70 factor (ECF subfamily)